MRHCTNGPWGFSTTSGTGIVGYVISAYRWIPGSKFRDGKPRMLKGQLWGKVAATIEESDKLGIEYGYTKMYGRNSTCFVMSRAARKRGVKAINFWYLQRAKELSR